jgi:ribosomal protein S18 acetylase RimI-like enzyme
VTLRPPREGDFDAMLALMNAAQLAAYGEEDVTADELRTWLTTPSVDPVRDIRLLEEGGRLIGYVDADSSGEEKPDRWWSDVKVDPEADAHSVVPELVAWLEQRVGEGILRVWAGATDERMGAPRSPSWPEGIALRAYLPEDERLAYDLTVEVWLDTSDPLQESFEEWAHWSTRREGFNPTLWWFAVAGDEPAGFLFCREDETDPNAGYVGSLGVRRRRGLGEALLLHAFEEFRKRGYTRATLGVDASSPTGATRLYERGGMRVYRDTMFLERDVRSSAT